MRLIKFILVVLVALIANDSFALPFNQDMVNGQLQNGSIMRGSPNSSVPLGASKRQVKVQGNEEIFSALSIKRGERLFNVNCSPCHGYYSSKGYVEGNVKPFIELKPVPNLTDKVIADKDNDHYINVINKGLGLMPGYGERLSMQEHWDVIHYLRKVQSKR